MSSISSSADHHVATTKPLALTATRDRIVLTLLSTSALLGLAVDVRKHNSSASLDSFFTSAHAMLYAAVTGYACFVLWICRRHMVENGIGRLGRAAIPRGWEAAVMAIVACAVAGVGDMSWHLAYGIEQGNDIFFSPTHIILISGLTMLPFGAIRTYWADSAPETTNGRRFWPIAVAAGSAISAVPVLFLFTNVTGGGVLSANFPAEMTTPEPNTGIVASELFNNLYTSGVLIHSAVIFGVMLCIARRWSLPFGAATLMMTVFAINSVIWFDFQVWRQPVSFVVGGFCIDLMWLGFKSLKNRRLAFRLFALLSPIVLWGSYLLISLTDTAAAISMSREQWTGTIFWTGIIGLASTAVLVPPRKQPVTHLD